MKAEELQEWLLSEGIGQDLEHIARRTVSLEFSANVVLDEAGDGPIDWSRLLLAGSIHFTIQKDGYGGRCFWVVRVDGSQEDFTYKRCVTGIW